MSQIDHAAEQFFATTCRDRMNQLEKRLFDHFKRLADEEETRQIRAYLADQKRRNIYNNDRKRAS